MGQLNVCSACHAPSPVDAVFCTRCGNRLAVVCVACGTANAPDHQFCKRCGQRLAAEVTTAPPDATPEGERRQLTVMFCDLVGSTGLSARLDPEELRDVVRRYQQSCAEVIERADGHIAQYLGDGILAYFGYPRAHEDDARRALRTGLGIVGAIRTLSGSLRQEGGEALAVRVGIHTGPVVVGPVGGGQRQEELAIGETPNIAARLQTCAEPDTVVISATTHRLAHGGFTCEPLGERVLPGVPHAVDIFRVLEEVAPDQARATAEVVGLTPFVGREHEVYFLLERWELVKDGIAQAVVLSGEAGIGKSRLVEVFRERLSDEELTVLELRGSPYTQSSAFYPVIQLVEHLLFVKTESITAGRPAALDAAVTRYGLPAAESIPLFVSLLSLPDDPRYAQPSLSPELRKQKTLEAVHRLLLAAAVERPLLLIVEDLHWIDPSTFELLSVLVKHGSAARIFTLLTARPEFSMAWPPRARVTHVTLNRFTRRQSIAMVERVTRGKALPPEVLGEIVAKTDGVPLFLEELTKTVLESGLLREGADRYELPGPLPPLAIPATLQDSLAARLDRLGPAKAVAQVAAVLGREFSVELLQAVSSLDQGALRAGVETLIDSELVYRTGLTPHATYAFKHALVQDAAYQSLLRSTRQRYHRRTAEVLTERFPATTETQPELVAHHFTEAGLAEPAIEYWRRAGQRAVERSANAEAIGHLRRALKLLRAGSETVEKGRKELELQTALGAVLMAAKGYAAPEVDAAYARARELCEQLGETSQLFTIVRGLWGIHVVRADLHRASELGEQCLALAQRTDSAVALLWAHYQMGMTLFHLGKATAAASHFRESLALYDRGKRRARRALQDPAVACLSYTAVVQWLSGRPDTALRTSVEAIETAEKLSHPFSIAYALHIAAVVSQFAHRVAEVRARTDAANAVCAEHGIAYFLPWSRILGGWALAVEGDDEAGVEQLCLGLDEYAATGAALARPYFLALLADLHQRRGRIDEAGDVLSKALAVTTLTGERWLEAELHRVDGEQALLASPADPSRAEQCFRKAVDLAKTRQQPSLALRGALSLGRLLRGQGRREEARALVSEAAGIFTEGFNTPDLEEASAFVDL